MRQIELPISVISVRDFESGGVNYRLDLGVHTARVRLTANDVAACSTVLTILDFLYPAIDVLSRLEME